jgi:hypothetical protein
MVAVRMTRRLPWTVVRFSSSTLYHRRVDHPQVLDTSHPQVRGDHPVVPRPHHTGAHGMLRYEIRSIRIAERLLVHIDLSGVAFRARARGNLR